MKQIKLSTETFLKLYDNYSYEVIFNLISAIKENKNPNKDFLTEEENETLNLILNMRIKTEKEKNDFTYCFEKAKRLIKIGTNWKLKESFYKMYNLYKGNTIEVFDLLDEKSIQDITEAFYGDDKLDEIKKQLINIIVNNFQSLEIFSKIEITNDLREIECILKNSQKIKISLLTE